MSNMEIIGILKESSYLANSVAVVVTIVVLAISLRYTFRYLFNITYQYQQYDNVSSKSSDIMVPGHEGDDELEDEDVAECTEKQGSFFGRISEKSLSPRYPDPVEYCEHIQGEIKRVQQSVATKTIEESLSEQQLQDEKELQRQQLADIFKVMEAQQEKFGFESVDDIKDQMKLYSF